MAVERFYIIKDGRRDGPFDESYVRFLLENDEIGFEDLCETGDGERLHLGAIYEPADEDDGAEEADPAGVKGSRQRMTARPRSVAWVGHPSFLTYPFAWLVVIAGIVGGFQLGPHSLFWMLASFGLVSLAFIYIVLERSSHVYVITPRRIEAVHGLVAKNSTEIRVEDIRTINVRRNGLPGLIGVGTVEFSSTGDAIDVRFGNIWGALRIKKLVRRFQDELEER